MITNDDDGAQYHCCKQRSRCFAARLIFPTHGPDDDCSEYCNEKGEGGVRGAFAPAETCHPTS